MALPGRACFVAREYQRRILLNSYRSPCLGRDTPVKTGLKGPHPLGTAASCRHSQLRKELAPVPCPGQCFGLASTEPVTSHRRSPALHRQTRGGHSESSTTPTVPTGAQGLVQAILRPLWSLLQSRPHLIPLIQRSCPWKPQCLVPAEFLWPKW